MDARDAVVAPGVRAAPEVRAAPSLTTSPWPRHGTSDPTPHLFTIPSRLTPSGLRTAAALVKPGGRIAYMPCSVLPPENGDQVRSFVERHPEFAVVSPEQTASVLWDKSEDCANAALRSEEGWLMTPRRTGTDGFFVSVLRKT